MNSLRFLPLVIATSFLAMASGCFIPQFFDSNVPDEFGTWDGSIISLTLYDSTGKPYPELIAGLHVTARKGLPLGNWIYGPPLGSTIVLSRDGHALTFNGFQPVSQVEITGVVHSNSRLKGPGSDISLSELVFINGDEKKPHFTDIVYFLEIWSLKANPAP
jgi:hypothetical protein